MHPQKHQLSGQVPCRATEHRRTELGWGWGGADEGGGGADEGGGGADGEAEELCVPKSSGNDVHGRLTAQPGSCRPAVQCRAANSQAQRRSSLVVLAIAATPVARPPRDSGETASLPR